MAVRSESVKYLDVTTLGHVVEFDVRDAAGVTIAITEAASSGATWNTALPIKLRRSPRGPRHEFATPRTLTGPGPQALVLSASDLAGVASIMVENGPTAKAGLLLEVTCIIEREAMIVQQA